MKRSPVIKETIVPSGLNNACARADYFGEYSYKTVKTIIERRLDFADPSKDDDIKTIPLHNNIRGKRYYK